MALAPLTVASFEDGGVVITCEYDDASLVVSRVAWDNQTSNPYDVAWGDTVIAVPTGAGSLNLPGKKYQLVALSDGSGAAWGFRVGGGRRGG